MHKQVKFAIGHTGVESYLNYDKNSPCISSIYFLETISKNITEVLGYEFESFLH